MDMIRRLPWRTASRARSTGGSNALTDEFCRNERRADRRWRRLTTCSNIEIRVLSPPCSRANSRFSIARAKWSSETIAVRDALAPGWIGTIIGLIGLTAAVVIYLLTRQRMCLALAMG